MGTSKVITRQGTNHHTRQQVYSKSQMQPFFNQPKHPIVKKPTPQKEQETQTTLEEITLKTPTEFLLAGILEELKTRNMIELMKIRAQQEQVQKEQELAEGV